MWSIGTVYLALVVLYLVLGVRSYHERRRDSRRAGTPFALAELREAAWMALAVIFWPVGWLVFGFPRDRDEQPSEASPR